MLICLLTAVGNTLATASMPTWQVKHTLSPDKVVLSLLFLLSRQNLTCRVELQCRWPPFSFSMARCNLKQVLLLLVFFFCQSKFIFGGDNNLNVVCYPLTNTLLRFTLVFRCVVQGHINNYCQKTAVQLEFNDVFVFLKDVQFEDITIFSAVSFIPFY